MGRASKVLKVSEIVAINRSKIRDFGGFHTGGDNFANPGSLEHVLTEIQGSYFGVDLYPTTVEKAAVLGWRIITRHVFNDGNKRTGIEACRTMLELNGLILLVDYEIVDIAIQIASGEMTLNEFTEWLQGKVISDSTE